MVALLIREVERRVREMKVLKSSKRENMLAITNTKRCDTISSVLMAPEYGPEACAGGWLCRLHYLLARRDPGVCRIRKSSGVGFLGNTGKPESRTRFLALITVILWAWQLKCTWFPWPSLVLAVTWREDEVRSASRVYRFTRWLALE